MEETWKDIHGFEGYYQASCFGNIRSVDRIIQHPTRGLIRRKGRNLKAAPNGKGYLTVVLCKSGLNSTLVVHRIIAKTWIDNPQNLNQVNHINGNKTDNAVHNLEWCDNMYNMQHAVITGLFNNKIKNSRKPVILIKGTKSISFNSGLEASIYVKTSSGAIGNVLNGTRKSIKGYLVEYL